MGDYPTPMKKRDVFDRLRRRIQEYRSHQGASINNYLPCANGTYQDIHQETLRLHQRWKESKAKRAAKHPRPKQSDLSSSEQRNHYNTQQKLKRKIEASQATASDNANLDSGNYNFDQGSPSAKVSRSSAGGEQTTSVSVNIVHTGPPSGEHPSQIKLTVSSTLQTGGGNKNSQTPGGTPADTGNLSQGGVCKQEPSEESPCVNPLQNNQGNYSDIGLSDVNVEELQDFLDTLEKEDATIFNNDFLKDFDIPLMSPEVKEEPANSPSTKQRVVENNNTKQSAQGSAEGMFADPLFDSPGAANQNLNNMGGPGEASMSHYPRSATAGAAAPPAAPPILPETSLTSPPPGPAAETLKQMAAQHQSQEQAPASYGVKNNMTPYGVEYPENYPQRRPSQGGYPQYHQGQSINGMGNTSQSTMYPYSHQSQGRMPPMQNNPQTMQDKRDPSLSYRGTKPLSHYTPEQQAAQTPPSSLQQLQNQVHSQFGQTPGQVPNPQSHHMQITQTQQMHMSQGNQRMHLSQSQQMHVHSAGPQHISIAQHQSFNMNQQQQTHPQNANVPQQQYMNEQMKMQMMRRERQAQAQQMQQRQAQMQSYMNRPPPEYKVPPSNVPGGTFPGGANVSGNPLQTMQNMVNQTSMPQAIGSGQQDMYANVNVKSEMVPGSGNPAMGHHSMGGVQQTVGRGSPLTGPSPNVQGPEMAGGYGPQSRAAMMGQGQMPGSVSTRAPKPGTPTYTSAIMRNQRAPNVNVGPDGLNISQKCTDWPRPMMPNQAMAGPTQQQQMASVQPRGQMPNPAMMYNSYTNQSAMSMTGPQSRVQMGQQHQAAAMHMQQQRMQQQQGMPRMHQGMTQNSTATVMMQQSQQVHMQTNAAVPTAAPVQRPPQPQRPQHPAGYPATQQQQQQVAGTSEFPLDFFDANQTGNQDFLDNIQNQNSSDFNLIDEIMRS